MRECKEVRFLPFRKGLVFLCQTGTFEYREFIHQPFYKWKKWIRQAATGQLNVNGTVYQMTSPDATNELVRLCKRMSQPGSNLKRAK